MKVKDILEFLSDKFPLNTALDFDNVGLLVGGEDFQISGVVVALDCEIDTVKFAIKNGCNLIITHHPVIFNGIKKVLAGDVVYELIKNGISVISMHTNLDIAQNGVSEELCKVLDLKDISSVTASDGFILKSGIISHVAADSFAERIKEKLGGNVKYVDGGKPIENILVCSGSGGEFIFDAINLGFDAFVTSEIKHHQFLAAVDNNVSVFDAGHFDTEDIIVEPLKELLSKEFEDIDFSTRKQASKVYGNAKRYLMFSLYELFKNEDKASLAVTHPGISFTNTYY